MNQAIRGQRNLAGSNTTVFTTDNGLESTVYLHGNHIAGVDFFDSFKSFRDFTFNPELDIQKLDAFISNQ